MKRLTSSLATQKMFGNRDLDLSTGAPATPAPTDTKIVDTATSADPDKV